MIQIKYKYQRITYGVTTVPALYNAIQNSVSVSQLDMRGKA